MGYKGVSDQNKEHAFERCAVCSVTPKEESNGKNSNRT